MTVEQLPYRQAACPECPLAAPHSGSGDLASGNVQDTHHTAE
jgi:hypothetical protein